LTMDGSELDRLMGNSSEPGLTPQDYMLLHQRCAICHWPAERSGRTLECHHIIGGAGRKNLPCGTNFCSLCGRCHHYLHHVTEKHGGIPPGAILTAKAEEDGEVDVDKLAALKRRKALPYDAAPIPDRYLDDRRRRGGDPWP
jgi:hypothetical protein